MFFSSWSQLGERALMGVVAYVSLVVLLRISGKRTLTKLNAFDLVVTVALGSILATTILTDKFGLAQGIVAMATLVGAQYVIASASTRWNWFQHAVKSSPRLLFYRGRFLRPAMLHERITHEEIHSAVRTAGLQSLDDVTAVVLETNGTMSVVADPGGARPSALANVKGMHDVPDGDSRQPDRAE
jgi:uncharacterized membrane protein YcaP (DUF421 family)